MTELSEHFTLEEATSSAIATRLGIKNIPDQEQLMNLYEAAECLEHVRKFLGHPIHIDSWLRVPNLNRNPAINGSQNPEGHESGWCIDFICPKFGTPKEIIIALSVSGIKFNQLIYEGTWVHISFAPSMRQQILTAHFSPGKKTTYTEGVI